MDRKDRQRLESDIIRRHNRGESQRQISRVMLIDRKTIRKIIKAHEKRKAEGDDALARELPSARSPRPSKLDPYLDQITSLLKEFPEITVQRVFEILRSDGFDGKYTIVREHLRKIHPRETRRAFDPVYTPPGKQAQADWSPYTLAGCDVFVQAFSMVLHYSSYHYVDFTRNRRQPTLFRQLQAGFFDFGGIPSEIVFDSEKTVVDRWELGEPIINLAMADFAAYHGFEIHIAPRGQGSYKGGVERPFWTMERSFFNGRSFLDFEDARARLERWKNTFATRIHRTKRRTRVDMFAEERPHLKPLPAHPYDTSEIVWRIVDGYHRVLFETNTYSTPRAYVGYRLCVRATEDKVMLYDSAVRLLATHARLSKGAFCNSMLEEHARTGRIDIDKVIQRFELLGEEAAVFAKGVRARQRYAGVELSAIMEMQANYRMEDILAAIKHALAYEAYKASAVKRILEVQAVPLTQEELIADRIRAEIRRGLRKVPVRQRHLEAYQELLAGRQDQSTKDETRVCQAEDSRTEP